MTGTPEFIAWSHMLDRCYNPTIPCAKNYIGRGIGVCPEWLSFAQFFKDVGLRPAKGYTLERINNSNGYEPGNCKWATYRENENNKRTNVFIEFNGKRLTKAQWARELGFKKQTVNGRIARGWTIERALTNNFKARDYTYTINGKVWRSGDLERELGLARGQIKARVRKGWRLRDAITTPKMR